MNKNKKKLKWFEKCSHCKEALPKDRILDETQISVIKMFGGGGGAVCNKCYKKSQTAYNLLQRNRTRSKLDRLKKRMEAEAKT